MNNESDKNASKLIMKAQRILLKLRQPKQSKVTTANFLYQ